MMATGSPATIGGGPKARGFKPACAICAADPDGARANQSVAARSSLPAEVSEMKIAEIDWPLFWHAFDQQDSVSCGPWLARWVFADDGVRLSMRPEDPKGKQ